MRDQALDPSATSSSSTATAARAARGSIPDALRAAIPALTCCLLLGALFPGSVAAQERELFVLDSLVVTATPVPRAVDAVASNVTILSGRELRADGITMVSEALRQAGGLDIVRAGSFGAQTSVFTRGAESDHTLVLVDGMQMNQAGGSFDLSTLTMDNVERIEIVRGPASALYGSDAMAGVVHVVTHTGRGAPRLEVEVESASFAEPRGELLDGLRSRASLAGGSERFSYSAALSRESNDGILAFNNRFLNTVFSGAARFSPDDRTRLGLSLRIADHQFRFPTNGAGEVVDRNAFTYGDDVLGQLTASRSFGEALELETLVGINETDGGTDDALDDGSDESGFFSLDHFRRSVGRLQANVTLGDYVATVGGEIEEERQRSFSESLSPFGTSYGRSRSERDNLAGFLHLVGDPGPISFNGGGRVEDNEQFGTEATWEGGVSAHLPGRPETRLRGSVGTGIKEPTFFENFATGFVLGNPDLDPERSISWEVGIEEKLDVVTLQATWFDQRIEDLIQYTAAPPNPGDPNYYNVAEARSRGLELDADLDLGEATDGAMGDLEVGAAYTWLDTEVIDSGFDSGPDAAFVDGDRLLRRPTHNLSVRASTPVTDGGRLHTRISWVGERVDRSFDPVTFASSRQTLPGYVRWSLGGEWDVFDSGVTGRGRSDASLTLRVDNLLDEAYQEVWGFEAPGRQIYVGISMGLGGGD